MTYKRTKRYSIFYDKDLNVRLERKAYARRLLYLIEKNYYFIYLDEFGLNTNFRPQYGYWVRGKPLRLDFIAPKSKNYSFLGAIDSKGLIGYRLLKGCMSGCDFFVFLFDLVQSNNFDLNTTVFVLDNLRGHKLKAVYPIVEKRLNLLFLPIYTPIFNNIEYIFSLMKRHLKRRVYPDIDDMIREVGYFFQTLDSEAIS